MLVPSELDWKSEEAAPEIQNYRKLAEDYDETRYIGQLSELKEAYRCRALTALLPARADRALDVACGTGRGIAILGGRARLVVGLDGTIEMLKVAQSKRTSGPTRTFLCQGNAARLPFVDETFEVVTCLNFVHLFSDAAKKVAFIREIHRVLRRNGTAVIEFDNALQGGLLGATRKYLGRDIGYDWPWVIRSCFDRDRFRIIRVAGANLPFVWRVPGLKALEHGARRFPLNYLANRIFVQALRI